MGAVTSPEGLEADDMLGIEQDKSTLTTTICSLDKDLLQIPGLHFSWEIGTKTWTRPDTWFEQSELEGYRLLYQQSIKGDATDNIKGIPGKGKVFAEKVLKDCQSEKEMFDTVRALYDNDSEFLQNAGCVWILRQHGETFAERFNVLADL
jgi:DNA polymerase-1